MNQDIEAGAWIPSRRELFKALGLGAATTILPAAGLRSVPAGAQVTSSPVDLITRPIPRTNERLPAIGLGTFLVFDSVPGQKRDNLHEIIRRFWQAGGRVFDTSPLYGKAEVNLGDFATSLGISNQTMPWYPGKTYAGVISRDQAKLRSRT